MLLGSFHGDWYDAADLYRDWTLQQTWATPLTERTDVPALAARIRRRTSRSACRATWTTGPAPLIEEFLPYEKCLPLLQGVAGRRGVAAGGGADVLGARRAVGLPRLLPAGRR